MDENLLLGQGCSFIALTRMQFNSCRVLLREDTIASNIYAALLLVAMETVIVRRSW